MRHLKVPSDLMLKRSCVGTTLLSVGTELRSTSLNTPSDMSPPYSFSSAASHCGHCGDRCASFRERGILIPNALTAAAMTMSGTATYAERACSPANMRFRCSVVSVRFMCAAAARTSFRGLLRSPILDGGGKSGCAGPCSLSMSASSSSLSSLSDESVVSAPGSAFGTAAASVSAPGSAFGTAAASVSPSGGVPVSGVSGVSGTTKVRSPTLTSFARSAVTALGRMPPVVPDRNCSLVSLSNWSNVRAVE
mmetsp:Transcript_84074/g.163365  ORF Transcript_84074/g.163365 Transcript_84074/m.163365 type:complete len:250 (-) Transcript_84074:4905-5654(-)